MKTIGWSVLAADFAAELRWVTMQPPSLQAQSRDLFEHSPLMCFMVDAAGTVLAVNTFGVEQLGYTVGELVGHGVPSRRQSDSQEKPRIVRANGWAAGQVGNPQGPPRPPEG